jgi:tripartite ATP-independent transporter DctM subunit
VRGAGEGPTSFKRKGPAPPVLVSGTEILAILMLVAFFGLLMAGVPVALTLATSGFVFGFLGFGGGLFNLLPARIYGVVSNYQWLAIPLFVFMGVMLEKSRLAEDLLDVVGHLAGGLKGGMALGIIGVGVLMGATTGIVGATVITLGLLTLPTLLRRGYDPGVACGAICASGTLGQIIPPSLILILLSDILQLSVGTLFAAAVIPGLLLAAIYCVYIVILGVVRPAMVPAVPQDERDAMPRAELWLKFFKVVLPPLALVLSVLGSIIAGIAAPTEAASMGALGSILVTAITGRMSLKVLKETMQATTKITAMVMFILICAQVFSLAFRGLHGEDLIRDMFGFLPGGVNADIWFLMLIIFVLGFFIEWIEISYIAVPLFLPVFIAQNVDMVWLAMLICVNLQTSFLTPPFGWALFFLRGVAPPEITTRHMYVGIIPFVAMQILGVVLVFFYPQLALWLPRVIGW